MAQFERTVIIVGTAIINVPSRLLNSDPDSSDITCIYLMRILKRTAAGDTELLSESQTVVETSVTSAVTN